MEMVVWGNPITADTARDYGIIDEIVPMAADGGMDAVYDFVESIMKKPIPTNRRLSKRPVTFSPGDNVEKIITGECFWKKINSKESWEDKWDFSF